MAAHSSIPARRIPWTEEPGGLQSTGLLRVGHKWACTHTMQFLTWGFIFYLGKSSSLQKFLVIVMNIPFWKRIFSEPHFHVSISVTPHFYREVINKYSFFSISTSPPHPYAFVWLLFLFAQKEVLPIKTSVLPDQPSSCLSSLSM